MRITRKLAALGAFFVLAAAVVAGCGSSASVGGNTVAVMAGNKISLRAYKHWMYVAAKGNAAEEAEEGETAPVIVPSDPPNFKSCIKQVRAQLPQLKSTSDTELKSDCNQLFTQTNSEVVQFLIEAYWYQADAHKMGLNVTDKQINTAYAKEKKEEFPTKKDYATYLSESGLTDADVRYEVRVNTIYGKLAKKYEKKITAADISAYYKKHASEFGTPETRNIRIVLTKTQAAADTALSALKSGQSWDAVAKKYSTDTSSKDNGGLLTGIEKGQEEHALDTVAFSSPVGKLEGPVHGTFGWYVVQVAKITPATHESLSKASKTIKSELTQTGEQAAEKKVTALSEKNWGKQTTCESLYAVKTFCANYKAPKTTTTTPAASTPTSSSTPAASGTSSTASGSTSTSSAKTTSTPANTSTSKK